MVFSQFFSAGSPQQSLAGADLAPASVSGLDKQASAVSPPWILDTLFRNLSYDLEQVAGVIDPILTAKNHCYRTDCYIQGLITEDRAFLSTNLTPGCDIHVTPCGTRWLLGQGSHCALNFSQSGIALCHAAINFDPRRGFFIADLDTPGGTWVNGHRLAAAQRHYLQDGDLIKLGDLRFEFLQQQCEESAWMDD
ncbi:FHA domain-containing protein [Nodosilinea sp. LEGE 07088]|uniref:FHA domain-containing protein n=1 Tax=Nodosilinea sp. LEGE 07088 TaxID=2777968 RepID=UPI00187E6DA6|nr:FHA domain-containing protein [Nodosilinea sp. LEGE 07088]MBE9141470.1 FHA domain-containing protein [Nodosilinea sp. LEGE 07088]